MDEILSMLYLALSVHSNIFITSRTEYLIVLVNAGVLMGAKEARLFRTVTVSEGSKLPGYAEAIICGNAGRGRRVAN